MSAPFLPLDLGTVPKETDQAIDDLIRQFERITTHRSESRDAMLRAVIRHRADAPKTLQDVDEAGLVPLMLSNFTAGDCKDVIQFAVANPLTDRDYGMLCNAWNFPMLNGPDYEKYKRRSKLGPNELRLKVRCAEYKFLLKTIIPVSSHVDGTIIPTSWEAEFDPRLSALQMRAIYDSIPTKLHWLFNNLNFIYAAIKENRAIVEFASDALRSNYEFMMELIQIDSYFCQFASDALKLNVQFMLDALGVVNVAEGVVNSYAALANFWRELPHDLKHDRTFLLQAIKVETHVAMYAPYTIRSDAEFMLQAIRVNKDVMEHADSSLKSDAEFMLQAIRVNKDVMEHAHFSLKSDREFMLKLIKQDSYLCKFAYFVLMNDIDFMVSAIQLDPSCHQYASVALMRNPLFFAEYLRRENSP